MKFISKFNHGFTNRGSLLAVCYSKRFIRFKDKKSPQGKRYVAFSPKSSKCDFQDFRNV